MLAMQDHEISSKNSLSDRSKPAISQLRCREIQAPVAACLIQGFAEAIGQERALEIAAESIRGQARRAGTLMADALGGNSLADLYHIVEGIWAEDEALTVRLLEKDDKRLAFDVTRCRYAEMYDASGMKELGFCLSCNRDAAFVEGFNPHIKLSRTQTIMEGASYCNFRFVLER
jgi:hypothetical protein